MRFPGMPEELARVFWQDYCRSVVRDFRELQRLYPFSSLRMPLSTRKIATIRVVAVDVLLVDRLMATEGDFLGEYSKELYIEVPLDYRDHGCKVYGAAWVDLEKLRHEDVHFFNGAARGPRGYRLCVGMTESFGRMQNAILESVRTAQYMLVGYERVMRDESDRLEVKAYAHGGRGLREYQRDPNRYETKGERVAHGE